MGDGNRVRQGASWDSFTATHVRQGVAWTGIQRIWIREGVQWKLVQTTDQPPKLTCLDQNMCQGTGNPGCDTLAGCTNDGEAHRVEWDYSGAKDGYHLAIHRSQNGGGYVEVRDNIDLALGDEDSGCCEWISDCSGSNAVLFHKHVSSDLGSCTTTHQYRGRIEVDGTDTLAGSAVTHGSAQTGCDTACTAS